MSLYMSAFERPHVDEDKGIPVKDIDPEVLRRLMGTRSLATEMTADSWTNTTAIRHLYHIHQKHCMN